MSTKNAITLFIAVVLIVLSIVYLDGMKAHSGGNVTTTSLALTDDASTTTTSDISSTTPSQINTVSSISPSDLAAIRAAKAKKYPPAVEIVNPSGFVNTPDGKLIKIGDYIGKDVILIDFMTYSCINCQRTFPYLNAWFAKYKDQGLIIIGIHTPEFEFEKKYDNVKREMARYGIQFPVVLDNDYGTWTTYKNQYWPRKYLIDIDGYIREDHIGEGGYDDTEKMIQTLLDERGQRLGITPSFSTSLVNPTGVVTSIDTQSPETYFGANRNEYIGNGTSGKTGVQNFVLPATFSLNTFYFDGSFDVQGEFAQSTSAGSGFVYRYEAKNLYFVASADVELTAEVTLDGASVPTAMRGSDVYENAGKTYVKIKDSRLYNIISGSQMETHTLQIKAQSAGLKAFTLTFG
jgi:thiol-disulfide isomerase/thioredoxin